MSINKGEKIKGENKNIRLFLTCVYFESVKVDMTNGIGYKFASSILEKQIFLL